MLKPVAWGRAALTGAVLVVCAGACDSVLGIEEPQNRPTDGGEAGEPPSGGGSKPSGGASGVLPAEGGAAGAPEVLVASNGGEAGEGGEPATAECEPDQARCGGENEKTPEICDGAGHWVQNQAESEGECPDFCNGGSCGECKDGQSQCTVCEEGSAACNPRQPQACKDGMWVDEGFICDNYCDAGNCIIPPSCNGSGVRGICKEGEACCRSLAVPGGTFKRDYDGGEYFYDPGFPATISPFFLDKFEVTVGRMRPFVAAFSDLDLKNGEGKAPHIDDDMGWSVDNELPDDEAALIAKLNCTDGTWSDVVGTNDQLPINCVPFYVAYAFCIWDGGRLPTNAEWNFAASGGDEQRVYPWKLPVQGPSISESFAFYEKAGGTPTEVGSTPLGNGRWGHADLAGNVYEWTLDYYQEYFSSAVCDDCLDVTASDYRTLRGGSYRSTADGLFSAFRNFDHPDQAVSYIGFRCARDAM